LENAWHNRDIARGKSKHPPSHYVDRFCVDSAVFDPRALRLLVEVMGEDRVMLGSDYPFPLGELRVGKLVRDMQGLSDAARAKLLAGNARRFLGLQ
jgi:aminocarboxymuconate-semialdehyde decarboxylase